MHVELTREEWTQVMTIIGNTRDFPWATTNPLLMKMGQQLQAQETNIKQTNSAEVPINIDQMRVKQ